MDPVEVRLDFWYTAACCQGLHKSYQGAGHYGIPHADADKCGIGCPETPCIQAANADNPATTVRKVSLNILSYIYNILSGPTFSPTMRSSC